MKTTYVPFFSLNGLQTDIMRFVDTWAREKKTPIPLREIIKAMENQSANDFTTIKALDILLKKGYIRRAIFIPDRGVGNSTSFVQLRGVN